MENSDFDYDELQNIKVILLGNSGVGKTSLLWKFNDPNYDLSIEKPEATIGYEYLKIKEKVKDNQAQIHIWDTNGQDKYNSIASNYYRKAAGAICVYDIADRSSFTAVEQWISQLNDSWEEDVVLLIIGNKLDKEKHRVVTREEGESLAEKLKAAHYEWSAYTGYNVKTSFDELIKEILKLVYEKSVSVRKTTSTKKPKATYLSSHKSNSFAEYGRDKPKWLCK